MPFLDILAYLGATFIGKVIEVATAPTQVTTAPKMADQPKHNLAAIKARAQAHNLKGPYEAPEPTLRRSPRLAAKRDYIYKGEKPTKFHIFGALFYNGYRTFSMSGPEAYKVAYDALADQHYTVSLHNCTLADPIITLKVGTSPDPHRLVTEKLGPKSVNQYWVNSAGQKNGFYKEWRNGKLVLTKRYADDVEY